MITITIILTAYLVLLLTGKIKYKKIHTPSYLDYLINKDEVVDWNILWTEVEEEINHLKLTK